MDLNGDGHRDILSGSYSRTGKESMAGLFQVLWGQPDGTFKKAAALDGTDGEPLIISVENEESWTENICTRPFAVDWDGDDHLDLVVGNFPGTFYLFKGQGDGKFLPKAEQVMAGDQPLRIEGVHSDPFLIDWDDDGDLDLLSGSSNGGVQWAENGAGPDQPPQFERFQTLIKPGPRVEYGQLLSEDELTRPVSSTRVWAADINTDGKLDLLLGDRVSLISPAEGLSEQEFDKKFADWQKARETASAALSDSTQDEKQRFEPRNRYQELYRQRDEFMMEQRTGFVWLYLQK